MNFTIKEIYIALLPGFVLLLHILIVWNLSNPIEFAKLSGISIGILSLVLLVLGYANNAFASMIDHFYKWHEPKPESVSLPDGAKSWHEIKDALDKNEKVEGYFTRFAQARNMCAATLLSSLISVVIVCHGGCCPYIFLLSFDFALFLILLLNSLPHQRKRYYQVIEAEYEKLKKEQN